MTRKQFLLFVFAVTLVAFLLRFWQLGVVPPSPDWDEASLGYNAYAILHTGRDEYGALFPIILRSFDDYKPALYAYLAIPSIASFGLNTFAVRLPSAIFGTLTVLMVMFLIKGLKIHLTDRHAVISTEVVALFVGLLLAISPWHIQFSRVAFEANIGLTCIISGVLCFFLGLKKPWVLLLSIVSFTIAIYAYQSEKVFAPLLLFLLIIIYRKEILSLPKRYIVSSIIVGCLILLPFAWYTVTSRGAFSRAAGVSIFSDTTNLLYVSTEKIALDTKNQDIVGLVLDNRRVVFAKKIVENYLSHFSPNWLFITGDIQRHHAFGMGLLYLWELPFLCVGIYLLFFSTYAEKVNKKSKITLLLWLLLVPIPASITQDVPHAVRTIHFLPLLQLFTALGVLGTYLFLLKRSMVYRYGFIFILSLITFFNFSYYLNQYFVQTNYYYSKDWQYGYKEIVEAVSIHKSEYQKVIMSNRLPFDQSYIFFLFYLRYPPQEYQRNGSIAGYEFRPIHWNEDKNMKDTLFVGSPTDFVPGAKILKTIHFLDGTVAAQIVGT